MPLHLELSFVRAITGPLEEARKPPQRALSTTHPAMDPLLTVEEVSLRLSVSKIGCGITVPASCHGCL